MKYAFGTNTVWSIPETYCNGDRWFEDGAKREQNALLASAPRQPLLPQRSPHGAVPARGAACRAAPVQQDGEGWTCPGARTPAALRGAPSLSWGLRRPGRCSLGGEKFSKFFFSLLAEYGDRVPGDDRG